MTRPKTLFLVCNSHIDPVWLWPWEEGLAQTLATFRAAAGFCEETDGFVFCHNEALLYQWVEEYEPALFERIRQLVQQERWHVMGGWYLQPDVNLPSGESLVRQILVGKRYFLDRFGVEPRVGVNLDSFGHSRGLVQILRKSGYDAYLFCRPDAKMLALPGDDFTWVGFDGSAIAAHRAPDHYNTSLGQARVKVEGWLSRNRERPAGLLLWGVGNHGGGPSRKDLDDIADLAAGEHEWQIRHGRPEDYFDALCAGGVTLPSHASDLNPWGVGCYTSMTLVKQRHRRLEASLFQVEKMLAEAVLHGVIAWPGAALHEALDDLLFAEFHDTIAGSSVVEVETQALDRLGHGLDIVNRLRARAFFASLAGEPPAGEGEYPIFVNNPHPFPIDATIACEFQPPEPNFDRALFLRPTLNAADGTEVPFQLEKESCSIQIDQRKRLLFRTMLAPARTTRLACCLRQVAGDFGPTGADSPVATPAGGQFVHRSDRCEVVVDGTTGLLTRFVVGGVRFLSAPAPRPLVMRDSADPWGMKVRSFRELAGEFVLMTPEASAAAAGVGVSRLDPVRIIERGPVRTVVEALFAFGCSTLCLRYALPARGAEIEIEARVSWVEKEKLLKLAFPTPFGGGRVRGQVAFGVQEFARQAEELVAQRWVSITSADGRHALTIVNDATYGFDAAGGEMRLSLLRSPAYAGHPVDDVTPIVRQDRFEPRIDQGDRVFRFWMNAGAADERHRVIDREATVHAEAPMALCAFPPPLPPSETGRGQATRAIGGPATAIVLDDPVVQLAALKMAEDGAALVVRLFEPTGTARATRLAIPPLGVDLRVTLGPFEVKTLAIDLDRPRVAEADLLERPIEGRR